MVTFWYRPPNSPSDIDVFPHLDTVRKTTVDSERVEHYLIGDMNRNLLSSAGWAPASVIIWLCLTRSGNYKIHEFDWLKPRFRFSHLDRHL